MCTSPLKAWRDPVRGVSFTRLPQSGEELELPCGQCRECRFKRSRDWAIRCMHEAQMHDRNCFLTLTYSDENLPVNRSLDYSHYQKFIRSLRKRTKTKIRFYMCGEYGEQTQRPHYHACLFGFDFNDKKFLTKTKNGDILYTSDLLSKVWPYGHSLIGDVTFQSAAYVARYIMKKITGDAAFTHYNEVNEDGVIVNSRVPDFTRMSLKPGIGAGWLEKYHSDVYNHDHVVLKGKEVSVPRYYDKLVKRASASHLVHPKSRINEELDEYDLDELQYARLVRARQSSAANSDASRAARDAHHEAKLKLLKRNL